MCLTDEARRQFQSQPLHAILAGLPMSVWRRRKNRAGLQRDELRNRVRESWTRLLGNVQPPRVGVRGTPAEEAGGLTIRREVLDVEPGIAVPLLVISSNEPAKEPRPLVVRVAADGIAGTLSALRDRGCRCGR